MIEKIIESDIDLNKKNTSCFMLTKKKKDEYWILAVIDNIFHEVFHTSVPILSKCLSAGLHFRIFDYENRFFLITIEGLESSV